MSQEKSLMFCSHTCQNLMEHMGINQNLGWDEANGWFIPINWFVRMKWITLIWIKLLEHSHQLFQRYAILTHKNAYFIILVHHFTIHPTSHVLFFHATH